MIMSDIMCVSIMQKSDTVNKHVTIVQKEDIVKMYVNVV